MPPRSETIPSLAACMTAALLLAGCRCSGDAVPDAGIIAPPMKPAVQDTQTRTPGGVIIAATLQAATRAMFASAPLSIETAVAALRADKLEAVPFATALLASAAVDEVVAGAMTIEALIRDGVEFSVDRGVVVTLLANTAPAVRTPAVRLAGRLGYMDLILPMLEAATTPRSLRLTIAELASQNVGEATEAALLRCLESDPFRAVAEACAVALTTRKRLPIALATAERLQANLAKGTPTVALLLAIVEAGLKLAASAEAVTAIANDPEQPLDLRVLALKLTVGTHFTAGPEAHPDLRFAVADNNESIETIDVLTRDPAPAVRAAAIAAIGRMTPATTRAARLTPFLEDADVTVRRATIATIANLLPLGEAVAILSERLRTADDREQTTIIAALRTIPDRLAIDALIAALDDPRTHPGAWFALTTLSGENPTDAGRDYWRAWRDARFKTEPTP